MADRLRDSGGRVFLYSEQLANRKGFKKFSTDDEEFETVEAAPKPKPKKKKVAKKAQAKVEPKAEPEAPEGLEDWE